MKYICKKNCYARNSQGVFQRFNCGDNADFEETVAVPEHFEKKDSGSADLVKGKIRSEREELIDTLKNIGVAFSLKDSIPKLRKILKDAESE
ncbi:hypothetical protein [Desulfovibrio sp. UCD-KL4C]|uniref:hypothetical protein n=1 Tax=Desulfovibrio sp. UCD-KL4C TaxID=2578120 RepID=UPI0025BD8ED2|nr:hypothetical protein [Desulfovibrio sp. UCD-KL4C]